MYLFYLLLGGLLLSSLLNEFLSNRKILLLAWIILFYILTAFRGAEIGNDTSNYMTLFNQIKNGVSIVSLSWRYEYGFLLFVSVLANIFSSAQWLLIISATLFYIVLYKYMVKNSPILWLSLLMFFSLRFFDLSMNTIRFSIALSVVVISFQFLIKKKYVLFLLTVFLATLFHGTASVFCLLLPLSLLKNRKVFFSATFLVTIVLLIGFEWVFQILSYINPYYENYFGSEYYQSGLRIATITRLLVSGYMLFLTFYISKNEYANDYELRLYCICSYLSFAILIVSINFNLLDRVADYFVFFMIVFVPKIFSRIKKTYFSLILFIILVLILVFYPTIIQIFRPEWNKIYPYAFW